MAATPVINLPWMCNEKHPHRFPSEPFPYEGSRCWLAAGTDSKVSQGFASGVFHTRHFPPATASSGAGEKCSSIRRRVFRVVFASCEVEGFMSSRLFVWRVKAWLSSSCKKNLILHMQSDRNRCVKNAKRERSSSPAFLFPSPQLTNGCVKLLDTGFCCESVGEKLVSDAVCNDLTSPLLEAYCVHQHCARSTYIH